MYNYSYNFAGERATETLRYMTTFVGGIVVGFIRLPALAGIVCAFFPLIMFAGILLQQCSLYWERKISTAYAQAGVIANEVFSSIRNVAAYGVQILFGAKYSYRLRQAEHAGILKGFFVGIAVGLLLLTIFTSYAVGLRYGGTLILNSRKNNPICRISPISSGCVSPGDVITAFFAVIIGSMTFAQIAPNLGQLARARIAAHRIFYVIDRVPDIDTLPSSRRWIKRNKVVGVQSHLGQGKQGAKDTAEVAVDRKAISMTMEDNRLALEESKDARKDFSEQKSEGNVEAKEVPTPATPEPLGPVQGRIEFRNVSFSYPTRPNMQVLRNVSFVIEAGTTVALVGGSGCGKSSIVGLVNRLYDPTEGEILIDGRNIQTIDIQELRNLFGSVEQTPTLFSMSVFENIELGVIDRERYKPREQFPTLEDPSLVSADQQESTSMSPTHVRVQGRDKREQLPEKLQDEVDGVFLLPFDPIIFYFLDNNLLSYFLLRFFQNCGTNCLVPIRSLQDLFPPPPLRQTLKRFRIDLWSAIHRSCGN